MAVGSEAIGRGLLGLLPEATGPAFTDPEGLSLIDWWAVDLSPVAYTLVLDPASYVVNGADTGILAPSATTMQRRRRRRPIIRRF